MPLRVVLTTLGSGRSETRPRARSSAGVAGAFFLAALSVPASHVAAATRPQSIAFASPAVATAYVGVPFSFDPYARIFPGPDSAPPLYDQSGVLPSGITFSPLVGISGTAAPGSEGTYRFTWYAAALGLTSASQSFTLTVQAGPAPAPVPPLTPQLVRAPIAKAPASVTYATRADRTLLDNDTLGDCVLVAEAHLAEDQAVAVGATSPAITAGEVTAAYYQLTDGLAGPDIGTSNPAALAQWRQQGLSGSYLVGVGELADPRNRNALEAAVDELGGVLAYVRVPSSEQPAGGAVRPRLWAAPTSARASIRALAHEVSVVGYDLTGPLLSTWGVVEQATWRWWSIYAQAVYPVVTSAIVRAGHGPTGIPASRLLATWTSGPQMQSGGAETAPPLAS